MKNVFFTSLFLVPFSVNAIDLQLHECTFEGIRTEFTPNTGLTALLRNEVKEAVVYKVKYFKGSIPHGPKNDLAVMAKLPSKTLAVSFFDYDDEEGVVFSKNQISIDLSYPVSTDAPVIGFESSMNDDDATEGTCNLSI